MKHTQDNRDYLIMLARTKARISGTTSSVLQTQRLVRALGGDCYLKGAYGRTLVGPAANQ